MAKFVENLLRLAFVVLVISKSHETAINESETTLPPVPTTSTTEPPTTPSTSTTTDIPTTTKTVPTTTGAPITTTTPTPDTPPQRVNWTWTDNDKKITCILIEMGLKLNISYENKENKTEFATYNIPANSRVVSGSCDNDTQTIVVKFGNVAFDSTIELDFGKNSTAKNYNLTSIKFLLNVSDIISNANVNQSKSLIFAGPIFLTPLDMSYHCTKPQSLNLTIKGATEKDHLIVSKVQMEAFHKTNKATFSYSKDCEAIDTPDIVPIAVGCALVTLIVIVLIAYLVGRRRSQARGYLSM